MLPLPAANARSEGLLVWRMAPGFEKGKDKWK
jgi:hypothetical protein